MALALVCVLATGCSVGQPTTADQPAQAERAVVASVIDGDTVELTVGGRVERVRLLGIDAPESVHPSVPVQCFGLEASAELAALLPTNTEVVIRRDVEARDRYGRLLLYLYRSGDGLFVNQWLLENGLADTAFYEPNTALSTALTRARGSARAQQIGLWGACDGPDQPAE